MKRLTILGSTGSIGTQALQIVECYPERFRVIALSAGSNYKLLARQANRFRPSLLHIRDSADVDKLSDSLDYKPEQILSGENSLENLATLESVDLVLNSLVGFAGFRPTLRALQAGKKIALANKESLVAGGELIRPLLIHSPGSLIPVDSEHSAMLQCIVGEPEGSIRKIIITASGGPFRDWSNEKLKSVRPADALRHPNWEMGAKITIDSATMMNKGLEIIEAHWLFGLPPERIEPVIHPQSIIHSVVEFTDGSSKAQLGPPDMKVP
ncbi:MAG: 1-deoxy-D-xylulose-5-phosphate reductoisomerase, partial [Balneolaceae bacterium]